MAKLGWFTFFLCLAAATVSAYHIFPFYYYCYEIVGQIEAQAQKATEFTDEEIRTNLMQRIGELDIPIESADDLQIFRTGGKVVIDLSYTEVYQLDFSQWGFGEYIIYEFDFNPHIEAEL